MECSRVCIFEGRTVLSKVGGFYHNRYICWGVFRLIRICWWNYTCIYLCWLPALSSTIYLQKLKVILRSIFYHVCLLKDGNFFSSWTELSNITLWMERNYIIFTFSYFMDKRKRWKRVLQQLTKTCCCGTGHTCTKNFKMPNNNWHKRLLSWPL